MLESRRGFLIGAGAVLTTAFVKDARSFIHRNNKPLLSSPSRVVETMYWYEIPDEGYQLTLGPWSVAPPPPTWRKFFVSEGIPHRTDNDIAKICSSHCIEPGDFDKPMSVRYWEDWFDIEGGPLAGLITWSKRSTSALSAAPSGDRFWRSTSDLTQATAHTMSTREICCRDRSCRHGSSTLTCRLRLWRVTRGAKAASHVSAARQTLIGFYLQSVTHSGDAQHPPHVGYCG